MKPSLRLLSGAAMCIAFASASPAAVIVHPDYANSGTTGGAAAPPPATAEPTAAPPPTAAPKPETPPIDTSDLPGFKPGGGG